MTPTALFGAVMLKPAVLIASAAILAAALRRASAAARHVVWCSAITASLILPFLGKSLPELRLPILGNFVATNSQSSEQKGVADTLNVSPTVSAPHTVLGQSDKGDSRRLRIASELLNRIPATMVVTWLFVAVLLGGRRLLAELRVHRISGRGHLPSEKLEQSCERIARRHADGKSVCIRLSDETPAPAVAGIFRSTVLLPVAAESWRDAELDAVLVHEIGHIARRDCLLNFFADIAGAMYWCNPFVHIAVRRMRAESERACDDLVLRAGAEPEMYVDLLLHVARRAQAGAALPTAATAMARPSELEARLLAVLDSGAARAPLSKSRTVALAGLSAIVAIPVAVLSMSAAQLPATPLIAPEPDRRADSLTAATSERVPLPDGAYRITGVMSRLLSGPDSMLARHLITALSAIPTHDGDLVRERAAWALSQARDGRLIEPMLESLNATDWRIQAYAAWTLAIAPDPRAVPELVALLRHSVWRLRAMAAFALRASLDERASGPMTEALTDPAWQVRLEAVEYFAARGGSAVDATLRPFLNDRHIAVRLAAARAIRHP